MKQPCFLEIALEITTNCCANYVMGGKHNCSLDYVPQQQFSLV